MKATLLSCMIFVLHNRHDIKSREFVGALPKGFPKGCIVDWYGDPATRYYYDGPPPSAFPSVVVKTPEGVLALARTPMSFFKTLEDLNKSGDGRDTFESISLPGRYIGGIQIWEAENLVKWGYPSIEEEQAILKGLARIGRPISKKEILLTRSRRPKLQEASDMKACQSDVAREPDTWKRLIGFPSCLEASANRQMTQLLVTNLANRDPEEFAKKIAEVGRKHDLAELIRKALNAPLALIEVP